MGDQTEKLSVRFYCGEACDWSFLMRVEPVEHNVRKCRCADCKRTLEAGEGIKYRYVMFRGNGQFYYCCPKCDVVRQSEEQKLVDELRARTDGSDV